MFVIVVAEDRTGLAVVKQASVIPRKHVVKMKQTAHSIILHNKIANIFNPDIVTIYFSMDRMELTNSSGCS